MGSDSLEPKPRRGIRQGRARLGWALALAVAGLGACAVAFAFALGWSDDAPLWARAVTVGEWIETRIDALMGGILSLADRPPWVIRPLLVREPAPRGLQFLVALRAAGPDAGSLSFRTEAWCGCPGSEPRLGEAAAALHMESGDWDGEGHGRDGPGWVARVPLAGLRDTACSGVVCSGDQVRLRVRVQPVRFRPKERDSGAPALAAWTLPTAERDGSGPAPSQGVSLGVVGDSQSGAPVFRALLDQLALRRNALRGSDPMQGILHLGDVVQSPSSDPREWRAYLAGPLAAATAAGDAAGLPAMPLTWVRGNHDGDRSLMVPPRGGVVRTGPVAVLVLPPDGCDEGGSYCGKRAGKRWARAANISAWTQARFRIVAVHVPPCITHWDPTAWAGGESADPARTAAVLNKLLPSLSAPAHLVMSGHSHLYQRGAWKGSGMTSPVPVITLGASGGALETDPPVNACPGMARTLVGRHAALVLRVGAGRGNAAVEVFSATGETLDEAVVSA